MQVWRKIDPGAAEAHRGSALMVGNFDGLHLGHQALFAAARRAGGRRILLTFDPHPLQVLRPERALKRLFPREDLEERLPAFGIDLLVVLPFTLDFARLTPREFLDRCVGPFAPKHLIAGYDFHFGKDREGSLAYLQEWGAGRGAPVEVVPALEVGGEVVSSRLIRERVNEGRVAEAARLLGRPFYLRGTVVAGAGRGAGLGFPTLNQAVVNETLPALGVYATRVAGRRAVTNVGVNPTFGGQTLKVETHVLDGAFEARGQSIDVAFVERLRPEMKFGSVEDLKKQVALDILKAREALDGHLDIP